MAIIPDKELFAASCQVLRGALRPMHYKDLAEKVFRKIRPHVPYDGELKRRISEDIRERLLEPAKKGCYYVADRDNGLFLAVRQAWVDADFAMPDPIIIPGSALCGIRGGVETVMRIDHMVNKNEQADREARAWTVCKGLTIEQHVRSWFEERWPKQFLPPTNEKKWAQWCSHDFRMTIDGKVYEFDVSGERYDGTFGNRCGKMAVDFIIYAGLSEDRHHIEMIGFQPGKYCSEDVPLYRMASVEMLACWINCKNLGYSLRDLKKNIRRGRLSSP